MNDEQLKEIIGQQLRFVPKDIRSLLASPLLDQKASLISKRAALTAEQTDAFKQETIFVLIGLVHLFNYTDNLEKELRVSKDQARMLAQEAGREIFSGVKESVRNMGKAIEEQEAQQKKGADTSLPVIEKARAAEQPMQQPAASQQRPTQPQPQQPSQQPVQPQQKPPQPSPAPAANDFKKPVAGVLIEQEAPKEEGVNGNGAKATPSREALIHEIEHPALLTEHAGQGTIIDEKLSKTVKIPREEVRVNMSNIPSSKPQYQNSSDPYREPLA